MGRGGDQVVGLEDATDRGPRDEVALLIGVFDRQLARRQVLVLQGKLDEVLADLARDAVPDRPGPWGTIGERIDATVAPAGVAVAIGAAGDARASSGVAGSADAMPRPCG